MSDLKQYKKQRKKLKKEIKATKAHLARLKQELKVLRNNQQHEVIDKELDQWIEKPSLFRSLLNLFSGQ